VSNLSCHSLFTFFAYNRRIFERLPNISVWNALDVWESKGLGWCNFRAFVQLFLFNDIQNSHNWRRWWFG